MNLYQVMPKSFDYCYFVFAEKPTRAKAMCVHLNSEQEEYTDFRCWLLKKDVGGEEQVVDSELDSGYERVLAAGCRFMTEEEMDEWEDRYS
jgi:hypothetical protein